MVWEGIFAVLIASLLCLCWCAWRAPEGWEDASGFHMGRPDE